MFLTSRKKKRINSNARGWRWKVEEEGALQGCFHLHVYIRLLYLDYQRIDLNTYHCSNINIHCIMLMAYDSSLRYVKCTFYPLS
jgi:hypothetical protein